jgi:DNA invertase Pin-like site-specific DNA recombinase
MKFGYCRVSTKEQNLDMQIDALKKDGCIEIYKDQVSGSKADRPQLTKLMENLREGDVIVVWKLDRLGRSITDLIKLINKLGEKKVGLKSLSDPVDTTTSQGRFIFNLFASLAELERDIIRERTMAGLAAARSRGRVGGRPKGLSQEAENKALAVESLYKEKKLSVREIAKRLDISTSTLYAYLKHQGVLPSTQ